MHRPLLLAFSIAIVVFGTNAAINRPGTYQLGSNGTPNSSPSSGGVVYRGFGSGGSWRSGTRASGGGGPGGGGGHCSEQRRGRAAKARLLRRRRRHLVVGGDGDRVDVLLVRAEHVLLELSVP